jgi:type II secretion system protein G
MVQTNRFGFTLIELLIVVAIIGILASIAVPNFLGALTKAKIARSQADMRSLTTAIESYRVDWNMLPFPADGEGHAIPFDSPAIFWFDTKITPALTSPVSYISSLIDDPFNAGMEEEESGHEGEDNTYYHYYTRQYVQKSTGSDQGFDAYLQVLRANAGSTDVILLSHGPDGDHDAPGEGNPARYNITNGIISNGDLVVLGGGGS